jgi:hypothetical protein
VSDPTPEPGSDRTDDRTDDRIDDLVHRADLDGLVRLVDDCTTAHDWAAIRRIRDRARVAVTTGRQLWPVATLAEYRLALHAPPAWAAGVLGEEGGRFSIGPLTEVVAQHHTFAELLPHLESGPRRTLVAHERVLRGEHLDPTSTIDLLDVFDLPWRLETWEPAYALPTYTDDGVDAPSPDRPSAEAFRPLAIDDPSHPTAARVDDPAVSAAVRDLVEPWTASSNGHAEAVCVASTRPDDAVAALGVRSGRLAPITSNDALRMLHWAGASGGAHGRRRGGALGRFGTWWVLGALAGDDPADPLDAHDLGEFARDVGWWWWDANEPQSGWELRLAVVDELEGRAWAFNARDAT